MRITTRLLLRILLPVAAVVVVLGWVLHRSNRTDAFTRAETDLVRAAAVSSKLVDHRLRSVEATLRVLTAQDRVRAQREADVAGRTEEARFHAEALEALARRLLTRTEEARRIELYATDGTGFLAVLRVPEPLEPRDVRAEPWFAALLAAESARVFAWEEGGAARLSLRVGGEHPSDGFVASILFDVQALTRDAFEFAAAGVPDARIAVRAPSGEVHLDFGTPTGDAAVLRSVTTLWACGSELVLERPRASVVRAVRRYEQQALGVLALVLAGLVFAIVAAVRSTLMVPLSGLMQTLAEWHAGRVADGPRLAGSPPRDELRLLEEALLAAVQNSQRAALELVELNESLEARVAERTRESERARDQAFAASRTKSEFLANMSHEVRTPMNGVIGMAELMLESDLDAEQRDFARTIKSSAEGLLGILNDVLDFSKIEAGKLTFERVDFDVRRLVDEVADLMAPAARQKDLELLTEVDAGVPSLVRGDPVRIRQVVSNLMGNALKFTSRGEVHLRVVPETSGPVDGLRFAVRDTGIGIRPQAQRAIFDAFNQADGSTTRRFGGTGLGLAICTRLVELMGGEIGVTSEPHQGSTFWFVIPLEAVADADDGRRDVPGCEGKRVLIVDDNPTNRRILARQVSSWSMEPEVVEDGESALEALRVAAREGHAFDVALLDMQMPGMNGLELARQIAVEGELAHTPLFLLTSGGPGERHAEEQSRLFHSTLHKPVRAAQLQESLRRVLSGAQEPAAPLPAPAAPTPLPEAPDGPWRVLLVEDNLVNQKVTLRQLERLGVEVSVASNGYEALDALAENAFDLVLMDCQMPHMDGFTATSRVRELESERALTPVVAMTANAMQGDRERCLAAGMDDYISKPAKLSVLREKLATWLGRRSTLRP